MHTLIVHAKIIPFDILVSDVLRLQEVYTENVSAPRECYKN